MNDYLKLRLNLKVDVCRMQSVGSAPSRSVGKMNSIGLDGYSYDSFIGFETFMKIYLFFLCFSQETLSSEDTNDAVYEIAVLQQRTFPDMPAECAYCKTSAAGIKIKRCTKCLRIGYCNQ